MSKALENKIAKRIKILDAAYDLFLKNGISTTPIDEVVKRAGVAKGTFYLYFRDKHDLLDQIVLSKFALIFRDVIENCSKSGMLDAPTDAQRLQKLSDVLIDHMKENRQILPLIENDVNTCLKMLINSSSEVSALFESITKTLVDKGNTLAEAEKYIYLAMKMFISAAADCIFEHSPYSIEELRPELHKILGKIFA